MRLITTQILLALFLFGIPPLYSEPQEGQLNHDANDSIRIAEDLFPIDHNRTLQILKQVIEDASKEPVQKDILVKAYTSRGNAFYLLKEIDLAYQDFTKAIELDPNYFNARIRRGHILRTRGATQASDEDWAVCKKLNPNDPQLKKLLEQTQNQSSK